MKHQEKIFKAGPFRGVFINQSWLLDKFKDIMLPWFNEYEQQMFQFSNEEETFALLLNYMNVDQIEKKYGGKKPNINKFYPPVYWRERITQYLNDVI